MGATITMAKQAAAFAAASGATFYVLFEETYEKNCYPHDPSWSTVSIGNLETTLKRIFAFASSCEGGCLQARSGNLLPESYIAAWLRELAAPDWMSDREIELSVGVDESMYSPIPKGKFEEVSAVLNGLGRDDLVASLSTGNSVTLSLHQDAEILAAIYGVRGVGTWRGISSHMRPSRGRFKAPDSLRYQPRAVKVFDMERPLALRLDDNRLLQRPDGTWYCAGWEYSIVANYISSLWEVELKEPGSYRKRISAYRDSLRDAPEAPRGITVAIDRSKVSDQYRLERIDEVATRFPVSPTKAGYLIVTDEANLYQVTHLDQDSATWLVPPELANLVSIPPQAVAGSQMRLI